MKRPPSSVIWDWKSEGNEKPVIKWGKFWFQEIFLALLVGVFFLLGSRRIPCVLSAVAIAFILVAFLKPRWYAAIDRFVAAIIRGVSAFLTVILFAPFFHLVFSPGALWLKLRKRDPLNRSFPGGRETYWVDRSEEEQSPDRYTRQF